MFISPFSFDLLSFCFPFPRVFALSDSQSAVALPLWVQTPRQITDGHLLVLAQSNNAKLATCDAGIPFPVHPIPFSKTALHRTIAEVFSTLTGGRLGYRCQPDDAAKIGRELASDLKFVELDEQETLHALATSRKHGVRGGQIHDYLHAIAARKAGALTIYTFNTGDFRSLGLPLTIEPPPCL